MDDEPTDITGANVRKEKKTTVADLANSPTFQAYVKRVLAPKFAWKFKKNSDDLEQDFWVKILKPSQLLKVIDYPKGWAGTTMRNLCINQCRDTKRERDLTEPIESKDGRIREIPAPDQAASCDDTAADLEAPELTQNQKDEICRKVLRIIEIVPAGEHRSIVHLRLMMIHAEVVAEVIKKSRATVYRVEKKYKPSWEQIVNELGLAPHLIEDPLAETAVIRLVAGILRDSWRAQHHL